MGKHKNFRLGEYANFTRCNSTVTSAHKLQDNNFANTQNKMQ